MGMRRTWHGIALGAGAAFTLFSAALCGPAPAARHLQITDGTTPSVPAVAADPRTSVGGTPCRTDRGRDPCGLDVSVRTLSPAPVRIALLKNGVVATEQTVGPGEYTLQPGPGMYQLCFSQPATDGWRATDKCRTRPVDLPDMYDVRIGKARARGNKVEFTVAAAGLAVGRPFCVLAQRLDYVFPGKLRRLKWVRSEIRLRRGVLRPRQIVAIPRGRRPQWPARLTVWVAGTRTADGIKYNNYKVLRSSDDVENRHGLGTCPGA